MERVARRCAALALALTVILGAALVLRLSVSSPHSAAAGRTQAVRFSGTIQIGAGQERPLTLPLSADMDGGEAVILRGRFDRAISEDAVLFFLLTNASVTISVGGAARAAFDVPSGQSWEGFYQEGIGPLDPVELTVRSAYADETRAAVETLLGSFRCGTVEELSRELLYRHLPELLLGVLLAAGGVLLELTAALLRAQRLPRTGRLFALGALALTCGLCFLTECSAISLLWPYTAANAACALLLRPMAVCLLAALFCCYLTGRRRQAAAWMLVGLLCVLCLRILLQFCGGPDLMETRPAQELLALAATAACCGCMLAEHLRTPGSRAGIALAHVLPGILGACVTTVWAACSSGANSFWLGAGVLASLLALTGGQISALRRLLDQAQTRQRRENDLAQRQVSVALNHLQPHFLYNALNAIQFLCMDDPDRAVEAVGDFAGFLRGNMDSIRMTEPVPLEREVQHLRYYLSLEKLRFGDRVHVEYDLRADGFLLPPLTLQPMVENAIRFGITKKQAGGTVCIRTLETPEDYRVVIADDGVGFDPRLELEEKRSHIDIRDVERRLLAQCGGSVRVECVPGRGTAVTMILPKEEIR